MHGVRDGMVLLKRHHPAVGSLTLILNSNCVYILAAALYANILRDKAHTITHSLNPSHNSYARINQINLHATRQCSRRGITNENNKN